MPETVAQNGKALAAASLWALLVGFVTDNLFEFLINHWDTIAAALVAFVPAEYAGIAAGVLTFAFKLIRNFKKPTAPKKIDPNY